MTETASVSKKLLEQLKKQQQENQNLSEFDKFILKLVEQLDTSKFSLKDKIFFLKELAYLLKWWVSIVEAVNIIKDSTDNKAVKSVCQQLYDHLKRWETLSRALVRLNQYFNETDVAVIRAWEQSWELVNVLQYLSSQYEFLNETRKKYFGAMLYPVLLFFLAIIAIVIILIYVIPNLLWLVQDFWAELPLSTRLLLAVSVFLKENIFNIFIAIFLIIFWFSLIFSTEEWQKWRDKMIFKLPIFWILTRYYYIIKFLRYMKLLIYSWLPFVDVFLALKRIMNNKIYDKMLDEVVSAIRKWESPFEVMENYSLIIPKDVVAILKVWEQTASIKESAENAVKLYEVEFNTKINNFSKLVEPILIVFVWWIVAWIALSIFGIIWTILDSINK